MAKGESRDPFGFDDPETAAFLRALDNIRGAIKGVPGWDACLALTICLAECIVYGNSEEDVDHDETMRLAQTVRALGDIIVDMMADVGAEGDDDGEETSRPSPPSPDLLRKFLERRRPISPEGSA
jgi:hypothetical protein